MEQETSTNRSAEKFKEQDALLKNLLGGLLVLTIALILFVPAVSEIYVDPRDPGFSSRDFPVGVLTLLVLLCLLVLFRPLYTILVKRKRWHWHYSQELRDLARHVIPIMTVGFCYAWLISMFQYFLPTFLVAMSSMAIYGNRGVWRLIIIPLFVSALFYLVFFGLLGLYEEPGSVLQYNNQVLFKPLHETLGALFNR